MAAKTKKADGVEKEAIAGEVGGEVTELVVEDGAGDAMHIGIDAHHVVTEDDIRNAAPMPVMREAYWVCAACETDTRKYRDGYHHATFDDGHTGPTARDKPICPECGSPDMSFHAEGQQEDRPVWDIEHQCWRTPNGTVYHMELDANVIACPFCASAAGVSAMDNTKYECTHCNILIEA